MAGSVVEKEAAANARGMGRRRNAAAEAAVGPTWARVNKKRPNMGGGACIIAGFGRAGFGHVSISRERQQVSSDYIRFKL